MQHTYGVNKLVYPCDCRSHRGLWLSLAAECSMRELGCIPLAWEKFRAELVRIMLLNAYCCDIAILTLKSLKRLVTTK